MFRITLKYLCLLLLCSLCGCFWEATESSPEYLPMDDSEYPYADVPRVVIETEDFAEIRDRETLIPARMQIYGENKPESDVYSLTVRGRGNSSFKMPKYGMKLEFEKKESFWGMPKNRDWVLIGNFGDKSHLRNFMACRLSEWLLANYTPRVHFVELYLNRKYMGLYLFSENVKVAKNRVNIAENDYTFLVEKESSKKIDPPSITSSMDYLFHIKSPKNLSVNSEKLILEHINEFEDFIQNKDYYSENEMEKWLDLDDYLLYYWIQEFSKNEDGNFGRSIFFTWAKGETIHFGPIWDFDLAFGNASYEQNKSSDGWYIRRYRWNKYIFNDSLVESEAREYWLKNRDVFRALIDSIPLYVKNIAKVVKNEYKRWPVIRNTENWALKDPYDSYEEAIEAMVLWMKERYEWIDSNL